MRINVTKPLKNAVSMIRGGERQIYKVKYEKIPDWCAVCGTLGHLYKEHGTGIHPLSALVFKELRASWVMRSGNGPGGGRGRRGGGCRGGRSGRSGRSQSQQDMYGDEHREQDMEMTGAEKIRKRGSELTTYRDPMDHSEATKGTMLALPPPPNPSVVLTPSATQEPKRAKTVPETDKVTAARILFLIKEDPKQAGPSDGHRRAQ